MGKILGKRLLRELKKSFPRYLALSLIIILGMYLVISVVGASETLTSRTEDNYQKYNVEDGEFSLLTPLSEEQSKMLSDKGVETEEKFSFDVELSENNTLRVMKNRKSINLVCADSGDVPSTDDEVLIEKLYAGHHDISVGDTIDISGCKLTVSGTGCAVDYDAPFKEITDVAVESDKFGIAFVTDSTYEKIKEQTKSYTESYIYSYKKNGSISDNEIRSMLKDMTVNTESIGDEYVRNLMLSSGVSNLTDLAGFIKMDDNVRIGAAAADFETNKQVGLISGIIIVALITYVISVFVVHSIQEESMVIGSLYALGLKKRQLLGYYMALPVVIALVSGILGMLIGYSPIGVDVMINGSHSYYSFPELDRVYSPYLIAYSILVPVIVSALVNFIVINRKLSGTALSLIRNERKSSGMKFGGIKSKNVIRTFQLRQMLRESRSSLAVVAGMFIALLLFMIAMDSRAININTQRDNIKDTKYSYMYSYKYPEAEVPEGGEGIFAKGLSKNYQGFTLNVSVMGIGGNSKYFNAHPEKKENHIVVSNSVSEKYGVSKGDTLELYDSINDKYYEFTVDDVVQYSVGLSVFMDIDVMRNTFGVSDNYFNTVLSDQELNIDEGRLNSVITKEDIEKSTQVFVDNMKTTSTTFTVVSLIIFVVVLYLMMNMTISKSAYNISVTKIMGFRSNEIRKLYLDGNKYIIAVGALICIPLSKKIVDIIFPSFLVNVAGGMNVSYSFGFYPLIYAAVILVYLVINRILVRRINKITPAAVLKNRE